jgi:hypothetical protein
VAGRFAQTITATTAGTPGGSSTLPLRTGAARVSAITIRRLAVPMPAFLPSVNQIGFDSYDWIATTVARGRSHVLLWVIGAVRNARGAEVVDPRSQFAFPLAGRYSGRSLILSSPNVALTFSFGLVPMRRFELRGTLDPSLRYRPGVSLYAETVCATVPNYGPELAFTGICNPSGVLTASGTLISSAYRGAAARRPAGLRVTAVGRIENADTGARAVVARLAGRGLPSARRHVAAILLTDARSGAPVGLDYRALTRVLVTRGGRIDGVRLNLPNGTRLPRRTRAYVIVDAFPLASRLL